MLISYMSLQYRVMVEVVSRRCIWHSTVHSWSSVKSFEHILFLYYSYFDCSLSTSLLLSLKITFRYKLIKCNRCNRVTLDKLFSWDSLKRSSKNTDPIYYNNLRQNGLKGRKLEWTADFLVLLVFLICFVKVFLRKHTQTHRKFISKTWIRMHAHTKHNYFSHFFLSNKYWYANWWNSRSNNERERQGEKTRMLSTIVEHLCNWIRIGYFYILIQLYNWHMEFN